jgi:hypothetical protein
LPARSSDLAVDELSESAVMVDGIFSFKIGRDSREQGSPKRIRSQMAYRRVRGLLNIPVEIGRGRAYQVFGIGSV